MIKKPGHAKHLVKEAHIVQIIGNARITMQDRTFADGYLQGYVIYHQLFEDKSLSEREVYTFLIETLLDVTHPDRWNAGCITGWMAALFEKRPKHWDVAQLIEVQIEETEPSLETI